MTKVSVIVPVYNTEKYIHKCIDSLLAQTLSEVEIVAVDDGSTDSSGRILDEYAERYSRVKVFHQKNQGQAVARNFALRHCTGEYIGFIDSDDYATKEMFERLYDKASKEDLDYVGCGYRDFTLKNDQEITLCAYRGQPVCSSVDEMYRKGMVSPFMNFYRRETIEKAKAFFPEKIIYEDTAFFLMPLPYIKRFGYIEEPLACRLRRSDSTTMLTKPEKVAQIFDVIRCIVAYYQENGLIEQYRNQVEYFCVRILLCSSIERISTVRGMKKRTELVRYTRGMIEQYFKNYKSNPCFENNLRDFYMKHANYLVVRMVCEAGRWKKKKRYV